MGRDVKLRRREQNRRPHVPSVRHIINQIELDYRGQIWSIQSELRTRITSKMFMTHLL